MPYIKKETREIYDPQIDALVEQLTHWGLNEDPAPGDVNYIISKILIKVLRKNGMSYTRANNLLGAVEAAKLEFYRRWVVPHEDQKIAENSDI